MLEFVFSFASKQKSISDKLKLIQTKRRAITVIATFLMIIANKEVLIGYVFIIFFIS